MQGPADEAHYGLQLDMVSQSDKDFTSSEKSQKVNIRANSGTCNVCSAPCSSCLHNYQVMMGTKTDKFSGETWTVNAVTDQGIRFEIGQNSENSNVVGINSTSDSFSENIVGKSTLRASDASEDTVMLSHCDGMKFLEGHDDNLSCINSANESKVTNGVRNGDGTNLLSSSTCSPVEKSGYTIGCQTSSQRMDKCDIEDSMIQTSSQRKVCGEFSDKVPSSSSPTGPSSQNLSLMEIPLRSTYDSSELEKVENTLLQASNGKPLSDDPNLMDLVENLRSLPQGTQLEFSHDQLNSMSLKEVVSDVISDNPPGGTLNSMKKNEDMVEAQTLNVSEDSDMEEQDVKVCDICGDAGREDLLAVCSRCSDGAEHTYCMEEMVTKVPEGNWLCEECKAEEQMSNQRQDKIGRIDGNEKNNSCGQSSSENIISFDVEGNRTKCCSNMRTCGKRPRDDNEVSSMAKKPAIESITGSPRNSNSSKTAALSRESSFKNLDNGRMQPINHSSSATLQVNDTPESPCIAPDPRIQTSRGTFSKSHSFNFLNSKPKVKLVDQVALQRSVREPASFHLKEGAVKSIGKSMSFKSTNSSRSESKVKMISPRVTDVQDMKQRKERSSFERKSSFKSERPLISSTMARPTISMSNNEKKLGSLSGSSSLAKRQETKAAQPDNKSKGLLKSSSLVARRSSDSPFSSGEFKKPSSYVHSTTGVSSANIVGNFEQKLNQIVSEEDSSLCAGVAERPPCNTTEGLHGGLLQLREETDSGERIREHSGNRLWQGNINGGRAILCKKCKEFGHVAQSCVADDPGFSAVSPTVKFSGGENDSLKVAIEAALLRKSGVHLKHRAWGQSEDSSVSSMKSEIDCRDQLSSSGGKRNLSSAAEIIERHTVRSGLTDDSVKQETCDTAKQSTWLPVEVLSSGGGESVPIVPLDGKSSLRGTSTSAAVPIYLKSLTIPEHEYIWQGSFEVFRSGKILDLREGIQAHLSTCASPKVIESVNKFNHKIILNEVPRLSTWPVQFQEFGVREDNIALFFFARDCESYEKSYKILLESMMKNDLALKANLNGVELLIFPSNQLPENSQRWNMLFFLWGVFRGKEENCSQRLPESSTQFCTPPDIPPATMSLPENICSLGPVAKVLSACDDVGPSPEVSASGKLWSYLSSKVVKGDFGTKVLSADQLDDRLDSISLSTERSMSAKLCHEMSGTCLEGDTGSIFTPEAESQAFLQTTGSANGSTREQILMQLDAASDRRQPSHYFDKSPAGTNFMAPGDSTGEGIILDKMNSTKDQVEFSMNSDKEAYLEENLGNRDLDMKESNGWLLKHTEHLPDDSKDVVPRTIYNGTSRAVLRNNSADVVLAKENGYGEGSNESVIPERYFFPVYPHSVNGLGFVNKSLQWKIHPEVEDGLHDKVPDLELALGAERKPLPQGIPPFLVGKVEKKITEAASKADDDASASLSLSLSFPS